MKYRKGEGGVKTKDMGGSAEMEGGRGGAERMTVVMTERKPKDSPVGIKMLGGPLEASGGKRT